LASREPYGFIGNSDAVSCAVAHQPAAPKSSAALQGLGRPASSGNLLRNGRLIEYPGV